MILMHFCIAVPVAGNHGRHFVGHGRNRSYVDGRAELFDQLDKVTWSTIMLENIVEDIGWEMAGRVKAYYCVPMLSLERNGLRALQSDVDVDRMMNLLLTWARDAFFARSERRRAS